MYLHHLLGIREGRQRHNLSIGVDVKVQCLTKNKAYEIWKINPLSFLMILRIKNTRKRII